MKNSGWSLVTFDWSLYWSPQIFYPQIPQIAKRKSHKWPNEKLTNDRTKIPQFAELEINTLENQ